LEWNGAYQCEASIPGLAGNILLLRPWRAQQGHSLALAFRRCAFTQGERIAFARIEALLPARTASGRLDVRCLGGLAEVAQDARDRSAIDNEADQSPRLPTAGAPQREDFINAGARSLQALPPPPVSPC
jgi:hypothetical protein